MIKKQTTIDSEDFTYVITMKESNEKYSISVHREKDNKKSSGTLAYYSTSNYTLGSHRFDLIERIISDNKHSLHGKNWIFTTNPIKFLIRHMN